MDKTCSHTFSPEPEDVPDKQSYMLDVSPIDTTWECPHDSYSSENKCIFHVPRERYDDLDISPEDIFNKLLEQIEKSDREYHQFIDSNIPYIDFRYLKWDSIREYPLDLRYSTIGVLNLSYSRFDQPLLLNFSKILSIRMRGARIQTPCWFRGITVEDTSDFAGATFNDFVTFDGAKFFGSVNFRNAIFKGSGRFVKTSFLGHLTNFQTAEFYKNANFGRSNFVNCNFPHCYFGSLANFSGAEITGNAEFYNTQFDGDPSFNSVYFGGSVNFSDCNIDGRIKFSIANRSRKLINFHRANLNDGYFQINRRESLVIGMEDFQNHVETHGYSVMSERITILSGRNVAIFDFSSANLGSVDISGDDMTESPIFNWLHLVNTDFSGFDFSNYRDDLQKTNWNIHELENRIDHSIRDLEITYLKAKNGASQLGDGTAVSKFFIKEMIYRRKGHWEDKSTIRWILNGFLNISCRYGERSSYVLAWSIIVVVIFAELYGIIFQYKDAVLNHIVASYATSLQAFGSVLFGLDKINNLLIRLLAGFEGFLGAFLIALFVFTITRTIRRY